MGIIQIADKNILDLSVHKVKIIHNKYNELKTKLTKLEEQKLKLSLNLAKIDKMIFTVKQSIDKLESEILKNIKGK